MTESPTPNESARHRSGGMQTKALAGLVAIMLAAAIVALVFVVNGGGNSSDKQAGGQRDVAHTRMTSSSSGAPKTSTAPATSTAPKTSTAPSTSAAPASASTSASSGASSSAAPTTSATAKSSSHSADTKKVVYTVKKGDTLSDIGRWYSDHGYLKLYDWNKSVIGKDPNLIFPGQKIIVVDGHVGVARHSH